MFGELLSLECAPLYRSQSLAIPASLAARAPTCDLGLLTVVVSLPQTWRQKPATQNIRHYTVANLVMAAADPSSVPQQPWQGTTWWRLGPSVCGLCWPGCFTVSSSGAVVSPPDELYSRTMLWFWPWNLQAWFFWPSRDFVSDLISLNMSHFCLN